MQRYNFFCDDIESKENVLVFPIKFKIYRPCYNCDGDERGYLATKRIIHPGYRLTNKAGEIRRVLKRWLLNY